MLCLLNQNRSLMGNEPIFRIFVCLFYTLYLVISLNSCPLNITPVKLCGRNGFKIFFNCVTGKHTLRVQRVYGELLWETHLPRREEARLGQRRSYSAFVNEAQLILWGLCSPRTIALQSCAKSRQCKAGTFSPHLCWSVAESGPLEKRMQSWASQLPKAWGIAQWETQLWVLSSWGECLYLKRDYRRIEPQCPL